MILFVMFYFTITVNFIASTNPPTTPSAHVFFAIKQLLTGDGRWVSLPGVYSCCENICNIGFLIKTLKSVFYNFKFGLVISMGISISG